ncbi:MAG TPA: TRAP transporter TatT component family protein [Terriglobales bacterium]|nr:TRAP transporter TatT component family protein [Terriglobales bacterium]
MRLELIALLIAVAVVAVTAPAPASSSASSLTDEVQRAATSYHEHPARIDAVRAALDAKLAAGEDVPHLIAAARASFLWGQVRATTAADKLAAFERGRELADKARALAPRDPGAHFWFAVNSGKWAEARGAWRALTTLRMLRQEVELALELDPAYIDGYAFLGTMYRRLPWLLGGDLAKAEAMYRKGLELDPTYTNLRLGLAKVLLATNRREEARKELERVVAEPSPRNRAEWTLEQAPEAKKLLETER